jgi:diacylglycerol kinase family enzyme
MAVVGERAARAAVVVKPTTVADLDLLRDALTATMTAAGWSSSLRLPTTAVEPGYGMTQRALDDGAALVVACGGDGTVRVVSTVLAGSGIPLGVVPVGTGNLLARNLGLPLGDPQAALRIALTGTDRAIDVARIEPSSPDGRPERFAIMAGVGFDAAMMRDARYPKPEDPDGMGRLPGVRGPAPAGLVHARAGAHRPGRADPGARPYRGDRQCPQPSRRAATAARRPP